MHYAYTEDHTEIASLVREVLAEACDSETLRTAWQNQEPPGELLETLGELGVPGLLVAGDRGGQQLDELFLSKVCEEIGRACVPLPVSETIVTAAALPAGHEALTAVLAGRSFLTIADETGLAPWAHRADHIAIGSRIHPGARVNREQLAVIDRARPLSRVTPAADSDAPSDSALVDVARARERMTLAVAAELVGLSRAMLQLTIAYVGERQQFGAAIGSFQAIKHHLADARIHLEFAAPALAEAAWRLSTEATTTQPWLANARLRASRAARAIARIAIQCHGAMGYTTEYPLHFHAKRVWALTQGAQNERGQRRAILTHLRLDQARQHPTPVGQAAANKEF